MRQVLTQRSTYTTYSRRSSRLLSSSIWRQKSKQCVCCEKLDVCEPLWSPATQHLLGQRGNSIMATPLTGKDHVDLPMNHSVKFSCWYSKETQNVKDKCRPSREPQKLLRKLNCFGFTLNIARLFILKVNEGDESYSKHTWARNT